jgi:hypothetical protein
MMMNDLDSYLICQGEAVLLLYMYCTGSLHFVAHRAPLADEKALETESQIGVRGRVGVAIF